MARQGTGRKTRAFPVATTGLSENLWVKAGAASEVDGIVFRITGEAESAKGVRRLVDWWPGPDDPWEAPQVSPFRTSYQIDAITEFRIPKGPSELIVSEGSRLLKVRNRRVEVISDSRREPRSAAEGTSFATHSEWLYITNGRDGNVKWNGDYMAPVGVAEQPGPPSVSGVVRSDGGTASDLHPEFGLDQEQLVAYIWDYRVTYVNSAGQEGAASSLGSPFVPANFEDYTSLAGESQTMVRIGLPAPGTPDILWKNVYKRAADGGYYYFRTVPAHVGTIWDTDIPLASASMGELLVEDRGQPPTCRWVKFFRGRAYYAGITGKESFIWYSSPGFVEEVPLFNFFDVGSSDGEPVTGVVSFSDSLIIFKETSMWQITSLASGEPVLTKIDNGVGSIAPRASIIAYDALVFVSRRGVYGFDGSRAAPVTNKLGRAWENIAQERLKDAVAWKDEGARRVHIALPFDNSNFMDTELVFHMGGDDSFSLIEGRRITAAARYKDEQILGIVDTNDRPDLVVMGLSNSMEIFSAEDALSAAKSSHMRGTPRRADAGSMSARIRFGPYDQTAVGWSHDESMEVVGVDVIMGWTARAEIDVRLYKDRENIPDTEMSFIHAEPGSHQNEIDNEDLSYFPTQASELYGWGEKSWDASKWTGRRQTRHRLVFPKTVLCREIEIEFEGKREPVYEVVVETVGVRPGDVAAVETGRSGSALGRGKPEGGAKKDVPEITTTVIEREADPAPFEIHGFVLWLVAKGAEKQR